MGRVENDALVFLGAAVVLAFLLVLVLARQVLARRALRQRLAAAVDRLGTDTDTDGRAHGRSVEAVLARLEHAVDDALFGRTDATSDAERLRLALDGLPLGILVCDEHAKVLERSPGAAALLGDGPPPAALREAYDEVLQSALAGTALTRETPGPTDGSAVLRLTGVPLDDGRRSVGAMVVVEDRTEVRREGGSRDDIVLSLARVVVEPLAAVAVLAESLVAETDPAARQSLADRARAEAARARGMVDDVLELSRLVGAEARVERVGLGAALEAAVERVRPLADQRLVQVRSVPSARVEVAADRRRLDVACHKLVQHAVEGARPGGTVEVRVRVDGEVAEAEVREPGASLAGPWRPGLALAVVERAAEVLGGEVREGGGPGLGRSCRLRLPLADPVARAV